MWKLGHTIREALIQTDIFAATKYGASFDIREYTSDLLFLLNSDVTNAGGVTFDVAIITSDDPAMSVGNVVVHTFATITSAAGSAESVILKAGELKRYVRARAVLTGAGMCALSVQMIGTKKAR